MAANRSSTRRSKTDPPADPPSVPCGTELAIVEAQRDLENAEYDNFEGFLLNPLRHFVFRPLLSIEAAVLPQVAKTVPALDAVISLGLRIPFDVARELYYRTHREQDSAEWKTHRDARKQFRQMLLENQPHLKAGVPSPFAVRFELSEVRNGLGFYIHSFVEFWSRPKYNLDMWNEYTKNLASYCKSTGVDEELLRPIVLDPFLVNVRIVGAIQKQQDSTEIRRRRTATQEQPEAAVLEEVVPDIAVVAKMMRYACAAYGTPMMKAHDILLDKYRLDPDMVKKAPWDGGEDLKRQVCDHVGIPTDYVTHFYLGAGGDLNVLRYYISVDRDLRAVVLVIRGTFSITQWHLNFQGQSKPFAGGEAHSGLSDLATAIVNKVRTELMEGLQGNPSYKLMITGQSLGGGVAPLVNILLHQDPVLGSRSIECHAFAGPPVYYAPSNGMPPVVAKAISNCTHYIHGDDIVPYLGLHQVRRTNAQLTAMDRVTNTAKGGFLPAVLTAMGYKEPTRGMIDAALYGDKDLEPVPGGPKLLMPASKNVWFVWDEDSDEVNYTICTPQAFGQLSIYLCGETSFKNHVPHSYEYVLNKAERCGWGLKTFVGV